MVPGKEHRTEANLCPEAYLFSLDASSGHEGSVATAKVNHFDVPAVEDEHGMLTGNTWVIEANCHADNSTDKAALGCRHARNRRGSQNPCPTSPAAASRYWYW
jgi:hypothetical protein